MSDIKVGVLLKGAEGRDAIHIAIAPVTAGEALKPGDRCVLQGADTVVRTHAEGIGIVDPFLGDAVRPGERFYLWLNPYTITSLRHEWVHPSFPQPETARSGSERWLRDLAERLDVTYRTLLDGAARAIESRRSGSQWPEYLVGSTGMEGEQTPPDFWQHYEIVTGETVEEDVRENFFSCAC